MEVNTCIKASFSVIGKEGSTDEGAGFVQRLWNDANAHFGDVAALAGKNETGGMLGIWGAMTDFSRSFQPWEDGFSRGLYLAGVEVPEDACPPEGWVKWTIPAYEYLYVKTEGPHTFSDVLTYMADHGMSLAGAVHDYICPQDNQGYQFFPIRRL
jgi:predicted transcriptional regulator YdeE